MSSFFVDPDIRKARTIDTAVYTDAEVYARQREAIFARSWLYLTDTERLRAPGSAVPVALKAAGLDEPLLLTRDADDVVHCLSNVCTHRGNLVCEGETSCRQLRCRYHGRRFGLDGRFAHMPEFAEVEDFPSAADDLPRVPLGRWQERLLFASLEPSMDFETLVAPLRARLDGLPWSEARFDAEGSRDYLVRCNWALYVENYLEGFHIPYVHASLAGALDYGSYHCELFEGGTLQLGVAGDAEPCFALPDGHPDADARVAAYYYWLWPATMLNVYPWGLSLNVVTPLAVDRTRVSFRWYVWDPARRAEGAGADLDRVEREDEAIVEAVQRGVSSRLYSAGRYSATRETGVHHFHRMLAAALA